jgi:integrase
MTDAGQTLLVVDALHGLQRVEPVGPVATTAAADAEDVLDRLTRWAREFARGQADATIKAVRADWGQYIAWCEGTRHPPLPASPDQLEAFLTNAAQRGRKRTTLKRYVYTVGLIHEAAGLPNPAKNPLWGPKWAALGKALSRRKDALGRPDNGNLKKQTGALGKDDVTTVLASLGDGLHDLRDAALLALASDTLLRESQLVSVCVEHFQPQRATGGWTLWVPFSKTNQNGKEADYRYVHASTMARVRAWQAAAGIEGGLLFRPIGGRPRQGHDAGTPGELAPIVALKPREVARIFRRRAVAAGLDHAATISGHSARVGTANDLINNGATTAQIQHAGGWRSAEMVNRYTRRSQAGVNAVAALREWPAPSDTDPP